MTPSNRRDFFKASSALAAGLALMPNAHAAGADTIKVGLVGCGGRGTGAVENLCEAVGQDSSIRISSLGDVFVDHLNGARSSLSGNAKIAPHWDVTDERMFAGFDAYQKVIDSGVDLVILATPPGFRPMMIEAAVKAGKNIFTEKPVGVDGPGIRRVLAAAKMAKEKGLAVVAGTQRRHQAGYVESMKRIHDGAIGDLVGGQVYWNQGPLWNKPRQAAWSDMEWQLRNWLYFTWLSGDHIVEQHVHNIDVFNWFMSELLGAPNDKPVHPISAQGMGGRQVRTGVEFGQIYDHHYVEYTYPNGVVLNSQCRHQEGTWNQVSETIMGTKGICYPARGVIQDRNGKTLWSYKGEDDPDPYQVEHDELHKAIKTNTPLNNAYYGNVSSFTAVLGRLATYGGVQLKWDDAWNSNLTDFPDKLAWDAETKIKPDDKGFYPIAVPGKTKVI